MPLPTLGLQGTGNVSAGIGYRHVNCKLRATTTDFHGHLNHKIKGPTLSLSALL